ncbi:MAG TPA: serine/threonine-protein kinase [Ktedonobacteraceae bacterium]|nr:serine/threonine-protein kinase [Ktedonobacteraceae bacterium]
MVDRVGQQLGNYRLVRLLGQGGFAEVYLGEHIYLETPAAIKVLHTRLTEGDAEHFRNEARTIARLVHPHIVRVLDFGVQETTPYLVEDYAPNGTLRRLYPRGSRLPLATIVSYVRQIADALQYAHDQRVIHRDVKPENMLLGRSHEVLLSDFGIAVMAQSSRYQSTEGMQEMAGTVAYMAPEQIQSRATPRSDQYALGIVVYEWLTGERPFQGSFTEVAVKQVLTAPLALREQIPALPSAIEAVVMKALAKDPEQRYPTIKAFADALEAAYQQEPLPPGVLTDGFIPSAQASSSETILLPDREAAAAPLLDVQSKAPETTRLPPETESLETMKVPEEAVAIETTKPPGEALPDSLPGETAIPASPPQVVPSGLSRRRVLLGLGGTLAVAGAGGGIAWLVGRRLETSSTASPGGTALLYTYRGHDAQVWSAAWSPDGKRIASASSDKTVQVWNASDGMLLYTYTGHSDTVYAVTWSPDGRRVASASYDRTVQVWDATTGFYPITYTGHTSWVWTVAWSPDGLRIASGGGDRTVQVWDAATGDALYTYRGHTGFVHNLAWSLDSKSIVSSASDMTAQVWNASTGANLDTYRPYQAAAWGNCWSPNGERIASGCDDKTVQVWDAIGGDHRYVYYGHSDFVYSVAWSPDGERIASGGDDKTVQIWNAVDGSDAVTYQGHTLGVRSVAWSPDGKRIVSASWDKTIKVWAAPA